MIWAMRMTSMRRKMRFDVMHVVHMPAVTKQIVEFQCVIYFLEKIVWFYYVLGMLISTRDSRSQARHLLCMSYLSHPKTSATLVTLHLTPIIATSAATISTTIITVTPINMRGMKMR